MQSLHLETLSLNTRQFRKRFNCVILTLSILVGFICLTAFIFTSIYGNINSYIKDKCQENHSENISCFIRLLFAEAFQTRWQKYILVSLLLTYATVYFHILIESNRTNVLSLLSQTAFLTISLIIGIGVSVPIFFISAYIRFYESRRTIEKSPVTITTVYLALIYTILLIILPTYLYYFLSSSNETYSLILSIVLLGSPIGFAFVSLPFRFCSNWIRPCWVISSHRLIFICHAVLFILNSSLFFISVVSLFLHWSSDQFKNSYIDPEADVNPVSIIWLTDYLSLLVSLIVFMITNEYFFHYKTYQHGSRKIRAFVVWLLFGIFFVLAPCLAFPLYLAWRERLYIGIS